MSDTNNNESNKRKLKVLEHKLAGESSRDIAKTLKVSHSTVQRDYRKAIEEAFGSDEEAISFVRNKVTAVLTKLIDVNMKHAVGYTKTKFNEYTGMPMVYDPRDEEYLTMYYTTTGEAYDTDDHYELGEEHAERNCKCKRVEERLQESHLIKARWIHENTVEVPPSLEHQKVLLTIVKRLETIWGVAIPNQINKHIQ